MRVAFIIIAILFIVPTPMAQKNRRDSLKSLLVNERQDTNRVNNLVELGMSFRNNNPDSSILLTSEALSLSKRIGYSKGEASALHVMGHAYRILGNRPNALDAYLKGLKLNEKINNIPGIVNGNLAIGIIYKDLDNNKLAIEYFLKAKEIDEQIRHKNAFVYLNLGDSYFRLQQYDSAKLYSQQSFDIATSNNDNQAKGLSLSIMGKVCAETGLKKIAMEYYRQSIVFSKIDDNIRSVSSTLMHVAKLFEIEGQKDSALFYANQSYKISIDSKFSDYVMYASEFLSDYYKRNGNKDSAYHYLEVASIIKDTLYKQQGINQLYDLAFNEKNRQIEIKTATINADEERKNNLQLAITAISILTALILFLLLSRSILVSHKLVEFLSVIVLLVVFEFINLLIHPFLEKITHHSPVLMLLALVAIAALIVPLHHRLEHWTTKILVEKNKAIRLAMAKKTIQELEGDSNQS